MPEVKPIQGTNAREGYNLFNAGVFLNNAQRFKNEALGHGDNDAFEYFSWETLSISAYIRFAHNNDLVLKRCTCDGLVLAREDNQVRCISCGRHF